MINTVSVLKYFTILKCFILIVKIIFVFLNQNICCGYSKEASQRDASFEYPKHLLKLMSKKIFTVLRSKIVFTWNPVLDINSSYIVDG